MKRLRKWDAVAILSCIAVIGTVISLGWVKYYRYPESNRSSLKVRECAITLKNLGTLLATQGEGRTFPSKKNLVSNNEGAKESLRCPVTKRGYVYIGGELGSTDDKREEKTVEEMLELGYYAVAFDPKPHEGVRNVLFNDTVVKSVPEKEFPSVLAQSIQNAPNSKISDRLIDTLVRHLR